MKKILCLLLIAAVAVQIKSMPADDTTTAAPNAIKDTANKIIDSVASAAKTPLNAVPGQQSTNSTQTARPANPLSAIAEGAKTFGNSVKQTYDSIIDMFLPK